MDEVLSLQAETEEADEYRCLVQSTSSITALCREG